MRRNDQGADLFQTQPLCLGDRKVDIDVAKDEHGEKY